MNVYDFDKTIYDGDSTIDFYLYCVKKNPSILKFFPSQLIAVLKYKFKIYNKTEMKEKFYIFFKSIPDLDCEIKRFWDENENKIKKWYLNNKKDNDVIISASPEVLLSEACKRIGVKYLIASKVEKKTGKYNGLNCYGIEKVMRFHKQFPDTDIDEFYSDSYSDEPLAKIARKSFLVSGNEIKKW